MPEDAPRSVNHIYTVGTRVFVGDGPLTPGVILPDPEELPAFSKLVQLDEGGDPVVVYYMHLTPATLTPGRRVFRNIPPHRFGFVPPLDRTPRRLVKQRMESEQPSTIVCWDNGEFELLENSNLIPIIFEAL
jgi:hypothetical protein